MPERANVLLLERMRRLEEQAHQRLRRSADALHLSHATFEQAQRALTAARLRAPHRRDGGGKVAKSEMISSFADDTAAKTGTSGPSHARQ